MNREFDFEDTDMPDDERRLRGEARCNTCGHPYRRVVRFGECRDCAQVTMDGRDDRWVA